MIRLLLILLVLFGLSDGAFAQAACSVDAAYAQGMHDAKYQLSMKSQYGMAVITKLEMPLIKLTEMLMRQVRGLCLRCNDSVFE